jgi:signal peptidase II
LPALTVTLLAALVLVTNQLVGGILFRDSRERAIASFAGITIRTVRSRHAFVGIFGSKRVLLSVWALQVLAFLTLVQFGSWPNRFDIAAWLGVAVGGATSNLADRFRRGAVIDFIDVGFWPVFNLADVAITSGVLMTVASIL